MINSSKKADKNLQLLNNGKFYCAHILDVNHYNQVISGFYIEKPTGQGLVKYLKKFSINDEYNNSMKTYLVFDINTNELVAYFSLKAGLVSVNEKRRFLSSSFDSLPGVEIANLSINDRYKNKHPTYKNIAFIILYDFIVPIIERASSYVGMNMIYIFALPYPKLIEYYKSMGFKRLKKPTERILHRRIRPRYDNGCVFMYMKI